MTDETDLTPAEDQECWGCRGTDLPLKLYARESYGVGPASREDRWLCEICEGSHAVRRDASGLEPLSDVERDTLMVGHRILVEIRRITTSASAPPPA